MELTYTVTPSKQLAKVLQEATAFCQTLLPHQTLHSSPTLHVSLTHPLPLRRAQIDPFRADLARRIAGFGKFKLSAVGALVGYRNGRATGGEGSGGRAFLAIRVGAGHDTVSGE